MVLKGKAFVEACEDAREHLDHEHAHEHAQHDTDDAGRQRVSGALKEEHLGQVSALEADRTAHAHLRPPLGREHDEDQEDQKHADRY